ncbi:MAG: hypothetical protein AAF611_13565 [Bacteroidota bacterium]
MKKIQISSDRILLIVMALLLWYSTLLKACESETDINLEPKVTITADEISQKNLHFTRAKRRKSYRK